MASLGRFLVAVMGFIILAGCGGGSSPTTTTTTTTPVANTLQVTVYGGPAGNAVNRAYVSVYVCNAGSTTSCVIIPDVLLDTGSSGLRILASYPGVSGLTLNPVTDRTQTPVYECIEYPDGTYLWGPVEQAGVSMAGEGATNVPIQLIESNGAPTNVSTACNPPGGPNVGTSTALQANGILGVGPSLQDCGVDCAPTASSPPPFYWLCTSSTTCSPAGVLPATQVSNPVAFFNGSDNNGVMLTMNSLGSSSGAISGSGILYFGIGTQADNALGSAHVYPLGIWPTGFYAGAFTIQSTYNNVGYPASVDSSLSFTNFLDPATTGVPTCSAPSTVLYCPGTPTSASVSNMGYGGTAANASISIGNAQTLLSNTSFTAFDNLAGIGGTGATNDAVDLGMPFFYGKTVYVGIAGGTLPSGVPSGANQLGYWAF